MRTAFAVFCLVASTAFAQPACNYALLAPRAYAEAPYDRVFTADFDGDGRLDLGFGSDGDFTIRYGLGGGLLTGSLMEGIDVLAVADVIGDPLPDLIGPAVSGVSASRLVYRNRDGKQFADPVPVTGFAFVAADFTNDGRGDLVVHDGQHAALYQRSGNTLAAGPLQPLLDDPRELEAGDVDGDGDNDLLVLNSDGSGVRVLLNDGHGVFTTVRVIRPVSQAVELAVADFRDDGRADVLTVSRIVSQGFHARLEMFPDAEEPSTATIATDPQGFPSDLVARDVTGDGASDVLMLMTYPGRRPEVVVHVSEGGTLRRVEGSLAAPSSSPIEAADFTGDGLAELVMGTPNGFALITGNGDGTFYRPRRMEQLEGKRYLRPADLDGDGDDDLVYMEATGDVAPLVVAMNDGNGNFTVTAVLRSFHSDSIEVVVSNGDIVVVDKSSIVNQPVYVFSRNAAGEWDTRTVQSLAEHALTRDLDGDGRNELISIQRGLIFEGVPEFEVPVKKVQVVSGRNPIILFEYELGTHLDASVTVDDVTGDGLPDLIVTTLGTSERGWDPPNQDGAVLIFAGRGNGLFGQPETLASQLSPTHAVTGDFNGDGRRDIVFTTWFGEMFVAYGSSTGPAVAIATGYGTSTLRTADLNGDGIADLLAAADGELTLWIGSRTGLTRGDMYWTAGTIVPARLKQDAPYSLIDPGVVDGVCVPTRRRSVR